MKTIKQILIVLMVICTLICCSCGFFGPQEYYCDPEMVESVQIVRLEGVNKEYRRWEYEVLCNIPMEDFSIIDKINNLKHSVNWGDPYVLYAGYIVIRVNYHNGDYDLLYHNAQSLHRDETNHGGFFIFDAEQFSELVRSCLVKYSDFGVVTH